MREDVFNINESVLLNFVRKGSMHRESEGFSLGMCV